MEQDASKESMRVEEDYRQYTFDMFMFNTGAELEEIEAFESWRKLLNDRNEYAFEAVRQGGQKAVVEAIRPNGERLQLLNFSSYNYLGFGSHPEVIGAAKAALDRYGLGAASSPVLSGTYRIHEELEEGLLDYFQLADRGVSLFSSGYGANLGTIQAFMKPGGHILLDRAAHMSILEGAKLSGAAMSYFDHNDMEQLETLLKKHCDPWTRVLVASEGLYSTDGDFGKIGEIVRLAKQYGAYTLVDEAHSVLIAGEHGRGVSEAQGVLDQVDLYIMTFSKAFAGVGGALLAKKEIAHYVNWYAKCRLFSCNLDPAVTGGLVKVLQLARGEEGRARRARIQANADYLRSKLIGKVSVGGSHAWIIPVFYYLDAHTLELLNYLQHLGLDGSIVQFPATPKNEARIRLFVTSEHTEEQLDRAAALILKSGEKFRFALEGV